MNRRIIIGVFTLAAVLAGASSAFAQADVASATIKGSVTDQNKAVVVGAIVTAKSIDRGITRTGKTDSDGAYVIPTLQPGTYEVRIEAQGFEAAVIPHAEVTVGQIAVYDVELAAGAE